MSRHALESSPTATPASGPTRKLLRGLPLALRPGPALGYDLMRVYLGIGLFVRGVLFVSEPELLLGYLQDLHGWFWPYALVHFVAVAHLCGGVALALGLLTRLASAIQIPILFGAVFLIHSSGGLLNPGQSLEFSGLVLALLIVYFVFGSGELSLDRLLRESDVRAATVETPSLIPELPLRNHPVMFARAPKN
ncbi:MAG TPA: DoxX family protein [Polyangiaceae bacterium]|nr:DoxX family protein [Polyangiaceae bacterium]